MRIVSLHATHHTLPLSDLERLAALPAGDLLAELAELSGVDEVAVLSTCNRFEVYLAGGDPIEAHAEVFTHLSSRIEGGLPHGITLKRGLDSVEHLLRVASGLESLIVGEDQVQGQVREAYALAQERGTAGPILTLLFERALVVGKTVRRSTRINEGHVSIGSACVDLAREILGSLAGRRVLVAGTGEMARLVARALVRHDADATVLHRRDRATGTELARLLDADLAPLTDLPDLLKGADVVITATAAREPIITRALLEAAGVDRQLLLVDVGNPRNVSPDVRDLPHVRLEDLESLGRISDANREQRQAEVVLAEDVVVAEVATLANRFRATGAEAALRALRARADAVRRAEVDKALAHLGDDADPRTRRVLQDLARALTNKLLHEPSDHLKTAQRRGDDEAVAAARRVLALDDDAAPRRPAPRPRAGKGRE